MLKSYCDLGCEMSKRLHFINSYLEQETGQDDYLKESGSTKILRKWMVVTKDAWKNTRWQNTIRASSEMTQEIFINERATKKSFFPIEYL